jgi:hypothetical protein
MTIIKDVKIFSTPDTCQLVDIEVEGHKIRKWFGEKSIVVINYCKILTPIAIDPTDLQLDVEIGIAEHEGEDHNDVRMDCEIQIADQVVILLFESIPNTEKLFV